MANIEDHLTIFDHTLTSDLLDSFETDSARLLIVSRVWWHILALFVAVQMLKVLLSFVFRGVEQ